MRIGIAFLLTVCTLFGANAQDFSYSVTRDISWTKIAEINMDQGKFIEANIREVSAPEPATPSATDIVKRKRDAARARKFTVLSKSDEYNKSGKQITPEVTTDFDGLPISRAGIPNDNNMAISNAGTVVSVINSSVSIFNSAGDQLAFRTLASITGGQLPNLNRTYDPKVVYDPDVDRFILVFLQGSTSADTRIITGFSQTNDPTSTWNFYAVEGNPFGDTTWSDYPIIGISKKDLFITVNILKDNESWQEGFTQSVIWQIEKESGYTGAAELNSDLFSDLTYRNDPLWSICVVQGGLDFNAKETHFLTVRPSAESNDTVFLHTINNTWDSRKATYSLKVLRTNIPYGVPPSAFQPEVGYRLQTNDTRVLSAVEWDGQIQYVQTSYIPKTGMSGVFHGSIQKLDENFTVQANYIYSDTFEYGYPSIALSGHRNLPASSVITFSHVSELDYPGTSCISHQRIENHTSLYSGRAEIKAGEGVIETFLPDSIERWGDYTGIQPKYDEPGVVWMSGSFGNADEDNSVWIGAVKVNNDLSLTKTTTGFYIYPNPLQETAILSLDLESAAEIDVVLVDATGKEIGTVLSEQLLGGFHEITLSINYLNSDNLRPGLYFLQVKEDGKETLHAIKVFVE